MADEDPVDPTDPVEVDTSTPSSSDVDYARDRGKFSALSADRVSLMAELARVKEVPDSVLSEPAPSLVDGGGPLTSGNIVYGGNAVVPRGAIYCNDLTRPEAKSKFTFQYNPGTISTQTAWSIDNPTVFGTDASASTDGGGALIDSGLGLANSPETLGVEVLLNRLIEVNPLWEGPQGKLFTAFGTFVDLALLYRVINCMGDKDVEEAIKLNPYVVPATNVGFLTAGKLVLMFGNGSFVWEGHCTSISVTHGMFVQSMVPVLTTVQLSFQRTIGSGAGGDSTGANTAAIAERDLKDPTTGKPISDTATTTPTAALTDKQLLDLYLKFPDVALYFQSQGKGLKP